MREYENESDRRNVRELRNKEKHFSLLRLLMPNRLYLKSLNIIKQKQQILHILNPTDPESFFKYRSSAQLFLSDHELLAAKNRNHKSRIVRAPELMLQKSI